MNTLYSNIKKIIKRLYPLTKSDLEQLVLKSDLEQIAYKSDVEQLIKLYFERFVLQGMINSTPRRELDFEIALAEHCNLNCAGCDHFSPLAEQAFADFEETERDFDRLSSLFHGHAKEIRLLGGEPLLHPELIKFIKMARVKFPDADIVIITNGIRLLNQQDEFWIACKDNNIIISPTKYPIPIDFEAIEKHAAKYGVRYQYYGDSAKFVKELYLPKLDIEGMQNGIKNFLLCTRANRCVYLQHGRMYTCSLAPTAQHFNKYFGKNLKENTYDSIDIYKANSSQEVMEFLAKPIPFCRYCMVEETRYGLRWCQSKRVIQEWT